MKVTSRVARVPAALREAFYDCVEVLLAVEGAAEFEGLRRGVLAAEAARPAAKELRGALEPGPEPGLAARRPVQSEPDGGHPAECGGLPPMKKKAGSRRGWVRVDIERSDSYPGRILARELVARGLSQMELARRMGRPVQVVNAIVNNRRAITAETAIGLAKVVGMTPRFWMTLQVNHDLRKLGVSAVA